MTAPRNPLLTDQGSPNARWDPHPPEDATVQASLEHLAHGIAMALERAGITPNRISAALGDGPAAWRHKIAGRRPWQIDDLIGLVLAFDVRMPRPLWDPDATFRDLLPQPYRHLISRPEHGVLPLLRETVPWDRVATQTHTWLTQATSTGWVSTVVAPTAVREIVQLADTVGLRSESVVVTGDWQADPPVADIWWPPRKTRLTTSWAEPLRPPSPDHQSLRTVADLMFAADPSAADVVMSMVLAPEPVIAAIAAVLGQEGSVLSAARAKVVGLSSGSTETDRTVELTTAVGKCLIVRVR